MTLLLLFLIYYNNVKIYITVSIGSNFNLFYLMFSFKNIFYYLPINAVNKLTKTMGLQILKAYYLFLYFVQNLILFSTNLRNEVFGKKM